MLIDLGLIDYEECYAIQKDAVRRRRSGEIGDSVIIAEHRNIYTIGRTGRSENVLASDEILASHEIKVLRVDRGGDVTYHGPGQLVVYPIIDLRTCQKNLHQYLRNLEEVVISFLKNYDIHSERLKGKTGVWVRGKKIASVGVGASNWVTFHGLSVNINCDLNFFSLINPCGMKDVEMTSLERIKGQKISMSDAKAKIAKHFKEIFDLDEVRPPWLKKRLVQNSALDDTRKILSQERIHTVCESSTCPNQNECFANSQATFLLLGNICARGCAFCSAKKGSPQAVDEDEPRRILDAVKRLGLRYAVITSVTRDDLEDGGAYHFAKAVNLIKKYSQDIKVEVLTPDFRGYRKAIEKVVEASPDVFGHNIETVERLYARARAGADYNRSLGLLRHVKGISPNQVTKSSIMVGLGEEEAEIFSTMKDLREAGCDILTIGQYLRPRRDNLPVLRYVTPQKFERYKETAMKLGFRSVLSGPFVRSSYMAEEAYSETTGGII